MNLEIWSKFGLKLVLIIEYKSVISDQIKPKVIAHAKILKVENKGKEARF